jgi:hypothetical protein
MSCICTPLLTLNSSQSFLVMIWFEAAGKDCMTISCTGHGWALCNMADRGTADLDGVEVRCDVLHLHPAPDSGISPNKKCQCTGERQCGNVMSPSHAWDIPRPCAARETRKKQTGSKWR